MAHVDDPDPLLLTAVIDREQVPSREREQVATPRDFRTLATMRPPCSAALLRTSRASITTRCPERRHMAKPQAPGRKR